MQDIDKGRDMKEGSGLPLLCSGMLNTGPATTQLVLCVFIEDNHLGDANNIEVC